MADLRRVADAANHFVQQVEGYEGKHTHSYTRVEDVFRNLQYATPAEIEWAANATEAELRARAAMPADRTLPNGKPHNPFWYHSSGG